MERREREVETDAPPTWSPRGARAARRSAPRAGEMSVGATSMRRHGAGRLRATDVGAEVTVAGWVAARRDHGGVVFFDLRDASGLVQVVVDPEQVAAEDVHHIGREWVLQVTG